MIFYTICSWVFIALLLCCYGVFRFKRNPKTIYGGANAITRRKDFCSVGDHRYTTPHEYLSLPTAEQPSILMMGTHCAECGNYKTWIKE